MAQLGCARVMRELSQPCLCGISAGCAHGDSTCYECTSGWRSRRAHQGPPAEEQGTAARVQEEALSTQLH